MTFWKGQEMWSTTSHICLNNINILKKFTISQIIYPHFVYPKTIDQNFCILKKIMKYYYSLWMLGWLNQAPINYNFFQFTGKKKQRRRGYFRTCINKINCWWWWHGWFFFPYFLGAYDACPHSDRDSCRRLPSAAYSFPLYVSTAGKMQLLWGPHPFPTVPVVAAPNPPPPRAPLSLSLSPLTHELTAHVRVCFPEKILFRGNKKEERESDRLLTEVVVFYHRERGT